MCFRVRICYIADVIQCATHLPAVGNLQQTFIVKKCVAKQGSSWKTGMFSVGSLCLSNIVFLLTQPPLGCG